MWDFNLREESNHTIIPRDQIPKPESRPVQKPLSERPFRQSHNPIGAFNPQKHEHKIIQSQIQDVEWLS